MKHCIKCGTLIPDSAVFCPKCGSTQTDEPLDGEQELREEITAQVPAADTESEIKEPKAPGRKKRHIGIIIAAAVAAALLIAVFAFLPSLNKPAFRDDPEQIAAAARSVVKLTCYDKNGDVYCTGSAFAALGDGIFVTNYHVIADEVYSITAEMEEGLSFPLTTVLSFDADKDIAILQTNVTTGLPVLEAGNADTLVKGCDVIAIGSPLGLKNTVSTGVYSGTTEENGIDVLQFSAPISSGSSGGALFDATGKVIGITFASYVDGQNLNLAIPINQVLQLYSGASEPMTIAAFYDTFEHIKVYMVGSFSSADVRENAGKEAAVYGYYAPHYFADEDDDICGFLVSDPSDVATVKELYDACVNPSGAYDNGRGSGSFLFYLEYYDFVFELFSIKVDGLQIEAINNTFGAGDVVIVTGMLSEDCIVVDSADSIACFEG